ncbi:hypothetical protein BC831DRAFT_263766 [Entophlyctis helioformis]|nr:hypothetical protein BC831DRAFT_263766 [Entophlyctis helioformis]
MTGSCCDAPCHEAQADSLTVCTNCGTVVSAELLVVGSDATTDADKGFSVTLGESRARTERMRSGTAPGSFKGIAQMGLGRTMSELRKSNQTQLLLSAIHALRVPLTVQHPTMRLFETAVAKNVSLNGRRGVAGLAVCLMLALRQMSVPKPLPDILQFFGCDPALFGRIYRAIRTVVAVRAPPLDPSTYIARLCHITMSDKTDPSKLARSSLCRMLRCGSPSTHGRMWVAGRAASPSQQFPSASKHCLQRG